jgi:hypothetical protein
MLRESARLGYDLGKVKRDKKQEVSTGNPSRELKNKLNNQALTDFHDTEDGGKGVAVTVGNKEQTEHMRALLIREGRASSVGEYIQLAVDTLAESYDLSTTNIGLAGLAADDIVSKTEKIKGWRKLKTKTAELTGDSKLAFILFYKNEKGGVSRLEIDLKKIDSFDEEQVADPYDYLQNELKKSGFNFDESKAKDLLYEIKFKELFEATRLTSKVFAEKAQQDLAQKE